MENMFTEYPDIVTVEELKKMLHIGRNTAYALVNSGKIKSVVIGRKKLIPKYCIIDYLKNYLSK